MLCLTQNRDTEFCNIYLMLHTCPICLYCLNLLISILYPNEKYKNYQVFPYGFQAGVNFNLKTTKEHILRLLGSKGVQVPNHYNSKMYKTNDLSYGVRSVPKNFDARANWRRCTTIGRVRDQGNCGSCWVRI